MMPLTSFQRIAEADADDNDIIKQTYLLKIDGEIVKRTKIIEDSVLKHISVTQVQSAFDSDDLSVSGASVSFNVANISNQLVPGRANPYLFTLPTSAAVDTVNVWLNGVNVIDEVAVTTTHIEFDETKYAAEVFNSGVLIVSYIER